MNARIAFPFVGTTIGGSHVSASLLMSQLAALGYEPIAIVHRDGPLFAFFRNRGINTLRMDLPYLAPGSGGATAIVRLVAMTPILASMLRRNRIDIVHANDGGMISTWMPAARLSGSWALAHRRTRWTPSRSAYLALRLSNAVVAISNFSRDGLPDDIRRKTVVIENPFDLAVSDKPTGRRAVVEVLGERVAIVTFIGTLQLQKRPLVFLEAAAVIHRERPDVRFLMVGRDGEDGRRLRDRCSALGLTGVVRILGFREDASLLLSGSDLLLAPAVNEGHGRTLVEAMLSRVPVVASASGGHMEIVRDRDTGVLVQADDPEAMARAALDILADKDMARALAERGETWARERFSPIRHAAAVAELYETRPQ